MIRHEVYLKYFFFNLEQAKNGLATPSVRRNIQIDTGQVLDGMTWKTPAGRIVFRNMLNKFNQF